MKHTNRFEIVLLLIFILLGFVQSNDWGGCIDPANPKKLVHRGQHTTICLTVGPSGNWTMGNFDTLRYSFKPIADEYSRFSVPSSYNRLIQKSDVKGLGNDLSVHVSSQNSLSFLRLFYDSASNLIFPYLTAIIDVEDGVVKGISWDNACIFCSDNRCLENTYDFAGELRELTEPTKGCYLEKNYCDNEMDVSGTECDLKLYVVWTGTDADGRVLSSSKFRFSAYKGKRVIDSIRNRVSGITDFLK